MSVKKFTSLAVYYTILGVLLLIDWAMIIHVVSHIMQLGGIELYAVAGIFIFAITALPVIGVAPALTARINDYRYCRWTNRKVEKESNGFIGFAILIYIAFAVTFAIMSISNPDRFIIGQGDPIAAMFPEAFGGIITNLTTSENAMLASVIAGFLPLFTTLISFAVYALICLDKKEERLNKDIQDNIKKIASIKKDVESINEEIECVGAELVTLDNITDYVNGLQYNIRKFTANKSAHMQQIKEEQRQEFDEAQKDVETKIRTDINNLYDCGITKLAPIQEGNPARHKELKKTWKDLCQDMREKIATEMSKTRGSGQSYAAMVIAPPQPKNTKRGA